MTLPYQQQDNDCGLQALRVTLRMCGHSFTEQEMREALPIRGGASLRDLRDAAKELCGLRLFAKRDCEFERLRPGAVIHLRASHFVTVLKVKAGRVVVYDPSAGRVTFTAKTYAQEASGWVLLPVAAASAEAGIGRGSPTMAWLRPLLAAGGIRMRSLAPIMLISLLIYLSLSALNLFLMPRLTTMISSGTLGGYVAAGSLVAFVFAVALMFWWRHRFVTRLGLRFDKDLLDYLVRRLIDTSATTEMTSGSLLRRVTTVRDMRESSLNLAVSVFTDTCAVLVLLGFMVRMSVPLTGVVLALALAQVGLALLSRRPIRRHLDRQLRLQEQEQDVLITLTRGLATFRGLGATGQLRREHTRRMTELNETIKAMEYQISWTAAPLEGLRFAGLYGVLVAGAAFAAAGLVTAAELFAFLTLGGTVLLAMTNIVESVPIAFQLSMHGRLLASVLQLPVMPTGTHTEPDSSAPAAELAGVTVDRGSFKMRADVVIERGETVTIAGTSGAGKSTLARFLTGLDPVPNGECRVFGTSSSQWEPEALRPLVCYVPARSDFMHATLWESLTTGDPGVTEEEVRRVLAQVQLEQVVAGLRLGLQTRMRVDGSTFSAGEVQRFAVARALLRNPAMLVLDEATGSLDRQLELSVLAVCRRRVETLIVISHRPIAVALGSRHLVVQRDEEGFARVLPGDPEAHDRALLSELERA